MKLYKLVILLTILLLLDTMAEGWGRRRRWSFRGRRFFRRAATTYIKYKWGKREVPDQAVSQKCKFSDFDKNGDDGVSLEEFMLKMGPPTKEQIVLFSLIDTNDDDVLNEKELSAAQEDLGGCT